MLIIDELRVTVSAILAVAAYHVEGTSVEELPLLTRLPSSSKWTCYDAEIGLGGDSTP